MESRAIAEAIDLDSFTIYDLEIWLASGSRKTAGGGGFAYVHCTWAPLGARRGGRVWVKGENSE